MAEHSRHQLAARRRRRRQERLLEGSLLVCAMTSIVAVTIITVFVFAGGLPLIVREGLSDLVFGRVWRPLQGLFGILPMIAGSIMVTVGALVLAVPASLLGAVFMAEFAPERVANVLRPTIQLLAGIPSVVYGFWGLVVLVPFLRNFFGGSGFSAVAGAIILAIMILPTIINLSEDALRSVPREFKEGSMALGATHWQTVKHVQVPAAMQGIVTGVILGMGRAIGETMAVIMVTGNVPGMPSSVLDPVRTLTANIVIEMAYAHGDHMEALFATGVVLFVFIMMLNLSINWWRRKEVNY
ncbi:MAG: phosphate ABC transporter permease subunit PstC [Bacillota bacterium]